MNQPLNLAAVDLNLMVVFDALMAERHVSRAAARVGLSQPAMSHALRRLRELTDDELFTRGPGGMEPTPRALALAPDIGEALDRLRNALGGAEAFDPATSTRHFRVAVSDAGSAQMLPLLMPRLRAEAPGVTLQVIAIGAREGVEHVASGAADLGIGVHPRAPEGIASLALTSACIVCAADANNPHLRKGLTRELFDTLPHVSVEIGQDTGASIDSFLTTLGAAPRVVLSVPHFLTAVAAVVGSDLLAVVPSGVRGPWGLSEVAFHPLPFPAPDVSIRLIWRARGERDPALSWFRTVVREVMEQRPG